LSNLPKIIAELISENHDNGWALINFHDYALTVNTEDMDKRILLNLVTYLEAGYHMWFCTAICAASNGI